MMIKLSRAHPIGENPWVWKFLLCGTHDWKIFDWHKSDLQIKVMYKVLKVLFSAYWGEESLKEEQLWRLWLVSRPHQCVHASRKPDNLGFGIHTLDQVFYIITLMYNNQTHSLPLKGKIATSARPVEYCFQLQMPPFGTEEETFIKKDLKHSTNGKGWN